MKGIEARYFGQRPAIIEALIGELERGRELLFQIDDAVYRSKKNGGGSIGEHFRHNLNFVEAVLNGLETGSIDYKRRVRDPRVETNRLFAAARSEAAIAKLEITSRGKLMSEVLVSSEVDALVRHRSMLSREMEFVHSHTVHHHALIAERLAELAIEVKKGFGVAPSTLEYWKQKAA